MLRNYKMSKGLREKLNVIAGNHSAWSDMELELVRKCGACEVDTDQVVLEGCADTNFAEREATVDQVIEDYAQAVYHGSRW